MFTPLITSVGQPGTFTDLHGQLVNGKPSGEGPSLPFLAADNSTASECQGGVKIQGKAVLVDPLHCFDTELCHQGGSVRLELRFVHYHLQNQGARRPLQQRNGGWGRRPEQVTGRTQIRGSTDTRWIWGGGASTAKPQEGPAAGSTA